MNKWDWSYIVWAIWIFGFFLVPELLGEFRWVPWVTLSETSWHAEKTYPILNSLLFGFLMGLAIHIRFQTDLWKALLGGMIIAFTAHFLWKQT